MIQQKKHLPSHKQKPRDKKNDSTNYSGNQWQATPHPVEKKREPNLKVLPKKNNKEDWEKLVSSLNSKTPKNRAWDRVRQLKGKDPKKITLSKSMEHSTKTAKVDPIK